MDSSIVNEDAAKAIHLIDKELSKRFIHLDSKGYFLISLDYTKQEIVVEHYENDIDDLGRAVDKDTGKPISCHGDLTRKPIQTYKGQSAKEVGIKLTEGEGTYPLSRLDHALYLGRELQKAEACLLTGKGYIQD